MNSNLPLKKRIPPVPVQDRRKAQKSVSAFGVAEHAARGLPVCLREFSMYDCLSQELQLSHAAPQALPLLGYISPLNLSLPLPPSSVNPCCCSGCAMGLCYLPRRPQPPACSLLPHAPWVMSHTAYIHGQNFPL